MPHSADAIMQLMVTIAAPGWWRIFWFSFLFRNLLTPELLATESDITGQVRILFFWASLVVMPLMLIYAITKRPALARVRLYHLGAWIFSG
jgi:hypothetical protein